MTQVRCYAGMGSPERPVAFEWQGVWLEVIQVHWQARTPEGLIFDVLTGDGKRCRLAWDRANDAWTVTIDTESLF
jgi:hypothetical protein